MLSYVKIILDYLRVEWNRSISKVFTLSSENEQMKSSSTVSSGNKRPGLVRKSIENASYGLTSYDKSDCNQFWSITIGSGLQVLMDGANYNPQARANGLEFFEQHVKPFLGEPPTSSKPPQWKSFMTDDYSPVEYSWSWESSPKIRYSFEPIGNLSGTISDPFNREKPLECVESLRRAIPGSDWQLFYQLADVFYERAIGRPGADDVENPRMSSPSSVMLAAEIGRAGTMAKAYLVPVRAQQTGISSFSVLSEGLEALQESMLELPAYVPLINYVGRYQSTAPFDLIGVAVDCVDPELAKLKIYLRSPKTSFDDVYSTLTMDGQLDTWNKSIKSELWSLWQLSLGLTPEAKPQDELPPNSHETGGILYNFDIQTNNALPDTKLYIPVKHYAKNDRQVLDGLRTFLKRRGQDEYAENFSKCLESLCYYRRLEDGRGLQTYISCAVKKGRLQLTSYMSAEVYNVNRWN